MRRFRNPVYAIESLERKLSPTGISPVAAAIYVATTPTPTPTPTPVPSIPDGSGDPPTSTPTIPGGPAMPA